MIWKLVSRVLLVCILAIASLSSVAAQTTSDEEQSARVIIAHLAPFADTVEDTSVSILVNGEAALENFVFGDATDYLELPAGDYQVDVVPTGADEPAISGELTLEAGQDYTAAAIGDGVNQPLELLALQDDNSAPEDNQAKLRIVHTAPFAAELSDTAVDIRKENGRLFKGLAGVEYKQASPYLDIRARTFDLKITAPGGHPTLIDVPPVTFESGDIVTVFAIGDGVNQSTGVLPVAGSPRPSNEPARVIIAHLAPFADTVEGTSVSILVNGEAALENFVFGDATDYLELPAGDYQVDVVPTGADEPAISGELTLEAGQDYTAAAIGDGVNQPLELLALQDDNSAPEEHRAKLRIVHTAPFAAELSDTAVDIRKENGRLFKGLAGVEYKQASPYLDIRARTFDLKITAPGGHPTLIDVPPVTFESGDIVTVFAIGDGVNQPTGVLPVVGSPRMMETEDPARVTIAHLAPFADTVEGTSVSVLVNGEAALENFVFGDTTDFIELPAGEYQVDIVPTGADDPAISGALTLEAGQDYTAAAIGDGANQPLELLALEDDNTPAGAGNAKIRVVHAAPFAAELTDTEVDIRTERGDVVGELTNVPYKVASSYLEVPVGFYDLKITTPGGDQTLIDIPPFIVFNNTVVTVFAIGDGTNQPVGVTATTGGTPFFIFPADAH